MLDHKLILKYNTFINKFHGNNYAFPILPLNLKEFKNTAPNIKPNFNHECYTNSLVYNLLTSAPIVGGIVMDKRFTMDLQKFDMNSWSEEGWKSVEKETPAYMGFTYGGLQYHAWNVKDNKIVDNSLGSEEFSKLIYYGKIIPKKMNTGFEIEKYIIHTIFK